MGLGLIFNPKKRGSFGGLFWVEISDIEKNISRIVIYVINPKSVMIM